MESIGGPLFTLLTTGASLLILILTQFLQAQIVKRTTAIKAAELSNTVVKSAAEVKLDVAMTAAAMKQDVVEATNTALKGVTESAVRREDKLDEIHKLVNSRLQEALNRIAALETLLKSLNISFPPGPAGGH